MGGDGSALGRLFEAAAALSGVRGRPCLAIVAETIDRPLVPEVRASLARVPRGPLDVVLSSPGGEASAAYILARELRRHASELAVFVPVFAKSAATLIALAADELVLGPLGELGPMDPQERERRKADFPEDRSGLIPFKAFEQMQQVTLGFYEGVVKLVIEESQMPAADPCAKAAELTVGLYGPLIGQLSASRVAESARAIEVSLAYARRILRRYRPDFAEMGAEAVSRLTHAYPSHGFVIDLEELEELGVPARAVSEEEAESVARLERVLRSVGHQEAVVQLVLPRRAELDQVDSEQAPAR